ncbi:hypothetical protein OA501_02000 [Flavobacteriaceae bacterium]|nr:hypothetical protein [Flavobacteriaceae bacterium]
MLKGIFSNDFINYINNKIKKELQAPSDRYQAGFNRVRYDIFQNDKNVYSLLGDIKFKSVIKQLTNRKMLFTQALAFELKRSESKGFPWHIGTQSFGFQRAEDFGCTIWFPLVPVKVNGQRGGISCVPTDKVSGKFMYEFIDPSVFNFLEENISNNREIFIEEYMQLRDGPLNDSGMKKILDYYAVEDNFELGDALIFDKNVIHKSIKLEDGPISSRPALAMRFTDSLAQYDKRRAENLEIPRKHWNYAGPTSLHLQIADKDGTLMKDSPLFQENYNKRLID